MARALCAALLLCLCLPLASCHRQPQPPGIVVAVIESSPNNLDPRQGTDAQSEEIGPLIFDSLVKKDDHFNLRPWLATSWEQPDPLTWIIHLRNGVHFQDGHPLEAADVVWTIESLISSKLTANLPGGVLISPKSGSFASVDYVEARDRLTVVFHMMRPDAGLLFNMSDGLFGVVPRGSGSDLGLHPIGSGPYRFVSQVQDKEVLLQRWPGSWSTNLDAATRIDGRPIQRLRFQVVPDTITSALELQKGSADAASNVLTPDMVYALRNEPNIQTTRGPGSSIWYLNFNVQDPVLKDKRVRQAIALSINRSAIVAALWHGHATLATSLLPPGHWAAADPGDLATYPYNPARAAELLQSAGFPAGPDGIRLHFTVKISTDETTRLLAVVLQQQMRAAGIDLSIRSAEFGTFYSDVTHGAFQAYILKWLGSNDDPDIFRYMYSSASFPPKGANRGHYVNPLVDALLAKAATETGPAEQVLARRRTEYIEVQKILSQDEPSVPLWFPSSDIVHTSRLAGVVSQPDGNFDYLR